MAQFHSHYSKSITHSMDGDHFMMVCRSLSEVPKGLRPIRTSSGCVTGTSSDDDNQLKGFGARLRWARQQCLKQSGNQHAAEPTPARVSSPHLSLSPCAVSPSASPPIVSCTVLQHKVKDRLDAEC